METTQQSEFMNLRAGFLLDEMIYQRGELLFGNFKVSCVGAEALFTCIVVIRSILGRKPV